MSADNWSECPKCKRKREQDREKAIRKVAESYGKVTKAEYDAMVAKAAEPQKVSEDTLREDYQLGVDPSGEFEVSYRCSCSVCDFEFAYKHTVQALQ